MNYNYTACCWFPTSSNILILPSQFWQIRFESCLLHSVCSKCWILVLLRYMLSVSLIRCNNEVLKKLHFKASLTHWRLVPSILGWGQWEMCVIAKSNRLQRVKCFKEVKTDKWQALPYSYSLTPIDCCVRINHKSDSLFNGDFQS